MPSVQTAYDYISTKINSLKDAYPSLRNMPNEYIFSVLNYSCCANPRIDPHFLHSRVIFI